MKFSSVLLSFGLAQSAFAFTGSPHGSRHGKPRLKENIAIQMVPDASGISPAEVIAPVLLMVGAIGATIKYAPEGETRDLFLFTWATEQATVESTPIPAPLPTPEPVAVTPVPAPEPVVVTPVPAPAPKPVAVKPVPAPEPEPAQERTIADIRREVAQTKDVESSKQILTRSKPVENEEKDTPVPVTGTFGASQEEPDKVFKGPGRKRRFVRRALKKAIAPWRKWENIK